MLGICFDRDFFYHPARRVEDERKMETVLYERWGQFGLGTDRVKDLPLVGATHLAAGFLVSEMLGCQVDYNECGPPQVHCADRAELAVDEEAAFASPAFRRFHDLTTELKSRYGWLAGDVNWSGVLNVAMDLRGQAALLDLADEPELTRAYFGQIAGVLERFVNLVEAETRTSSIAVNRSVRHRPGSVFLHSECSHTMLSVRHYEKFLLPVDVAWSRRHRPYGVHYCGPDAHRFAASFSKIPALDFLDAGWGSNLRLLRQQLPGTFLNIRLSPVEIVGQTPDQIRKVIRRLVADAGGPEWAGICCINMDGRVTDIQVAAIFEAANELRLEWQSA